MKNTFLTILAGLGLLTACVEIEPTPDCVTNQCVALTFDDGPGPRTEELLNMLAEHQVVATFFVLGNRVVRKPELVARMVAEGHEVGNHSWNHAIFPRLSSTQITSQVERTNQAISDAVGEEYAVLNFRPPYGSYSTRVAEIVPYQPTLWSLDTRDWETRSSSNITRIATRARPNDIILLHDINSSSVRAVPQIIAGLRERGFIFVTVDQLRRYSCTNC